ncbi:MAG TPA: hypothetical protein VGU45_03480 [Microvirga sp.]|jgi:hypothetical protein|nr:hypothetical protein [Microvirga sp.]
MTASSSPSSLPQFVQRVSAARRLNFGDLRRLQRDVLPDGPRCRTDVEALILLDASLDRFEAGWTAYLLGAVQAFVEGNRGAGTAWFGVLLERAKPKTAAAIARAVLAVIEAPDNELLARAKGAARRRPKMAACATGLRSSKVSARVPEPLPVAPSISFAWPNVRLGGTVLIARLEALPAE